jgi:hypothetical protein
MGFPHRILGSLDGENPQRRIDSALHLDVGQRHDVDFRQHAE